MSSPQRCCAARRTVLALAHYRLDRDRPSSVLMRVGKARNELDEVIGAVAENAKAAADKRALDADGLRAGGA